MNRKIVLIFVVLAGSVILAVLLYDKEKKSENIESTKIKRDRSSKSLVQIIPKQQKEILSKSTEVPVRQQQSVMQEIITETPKVSELQGEDLGFIPSDEITQVATINIPVVASPSRPSGDVLTRKQLSFGVAESQLAAPSIQNVTQEEAQFIEHKEYEIKIRNNFGAPIAYQILEECDDNDTAFSKQLNFREQQIFGVVKLNSDKSDIIITDPILKTEIKGFCIKSPILGPFEGCANFTNLKNKFLLWKKAIFQRLISAPLTSIEMSINGSPSCGPWDITVRMLP